MYSRQRPCCECKQSISPVLCQLQCDIFTAFSHAHPKTFQRPLQCPHCTRLLWKHTRIYTSLHTCIHKQANTYMCQSTRTQTDTLWGSVCCGSGPGPLTVPVSYSADVVSAGSQDYRTLGLAFTQFVFERNKIHVYCRLVADMYLRSPAEGYQPWVCVYGLNVQVLDSCIVTGFPPAAVTQTGLWDLLIWTDRVQAQLTSSCSFLSHARREEAGRVEGGGQPDTQCWAWEDVLRAYRH